mmetsp:Transcript_70547/g.153241  ORF Transcript_70547/g.153241 Transcript_70547/m.153241 type:complete len:82 (+) Transcript_70547:913-1158(+)
MSASEDDATTSYLSLQGTPSTGSPLPRQATSPQEQSGDDELRLTRLQKGPRGRTLGERQTEEKAVKQKKQEIGQHWVYRHE